MNRSNLNVLTAILLAAGAISPAALGSQVTNLDSIDVAPVYVVADNSGFKQGKELIKDGVLKVASDKYGVVGLIALNNGFEDVYLQADNVALDVDIDLSQSEDAVGVLLEDGVSLYFDKNAFIKADTAIRGFRSGVDDSFYLIQQLFKLNAL